MKKITLGARLMGRIEYCWLLLTDPIQVAEADVASFAKLYPMNARPVQKDNRRYVLQSS